MCPLPSLIGGHVVHGPFHSISPGHDWLSFSATPTLFFPQGQKYFGHCLAVSPGSQEIGWGCLCSFCPRHTVTPGPVLINPVAFNVPVSNSLYYLTPCPKSSCLFSDGDNSFLRFSFLQVFSWVVLKLRHLKKKKTTKSQKYNEMNFFFCRANKTLEQKVLWPHYRSVSGHKVWREVEKWNNPSLVPREITIWCGSHKHRRTHARARGGQAVEPFVIAVVLDLIL